MDCSPPDCSVREISQARILEWVAISFPKGSSQLRDQTPGIKPKTPASPALQADSLPLGYQGSPSTFLSKSAKSINLRCLVFFVSNLLMLPTTWSLLKNLLYILASPALASLEQSLRVIWKSSLPKLECPPNKTFTLNFTLCNLGCCLFVCLFVVVCSWQGERWWDQIYFSDSLIESLKLRETPEHSKETPLRRLLQ